MPLIVTEQRCFSGAGSQAATSPSEKDGHQQAQKRFKRVDSVEDVGHFAKEGESVGASTVTTTESTVTGLVGSKAKPFRRSHEVVKRSVVSGIVTRIDLLEYITAGEHQEG